MLPQNRSQKTVRQGIISIFYLSGISKAETYKAQSFEKV